MKAKISVLLIFLVSSVAMMAQDGNFDSLRDPRAREKIRAAHAAYITQRIELTPAEAERFWPVYREYTEKRRELRLQMRQTRRLEDNSEEVLKRDLDLKQKELDLEKEYTQKLGKIIPADKLVKLPQAEADFRKLLLKQIQRRRQRR